MMTHVWSWIVAHAVQLVAGGWALEKLLEVIGQLTGNKIVDNLGVALGRFLSHFNKPATP